MRLARIFWVAILLPLIPICAPPAPAQGAPRSIAEQPAANVVLEPKALALIKAMSEKLATAQSLSFKVRRAFDEPGANGQPLIYMVVSNVLMQRPDKFRGIVLGR